MEPREDQHSVGEYGGMRNQYNISSKAVFVFVFFCFLPGMYYKHSDVGPKIGVAAYL